MGKSKGHVSLFFFSLEEFSFYASPCIFNDEGSQNEFLGKNVPNNLEFFTHLCRASQTTHCLNDYQFNAF